LHSLNFAQVKAGLAPSGSETGKGKIKMSGRKVRHGYYLLKGKSNHPMEDYLVAEYKQVENNNLGLFAIFDGHLGHDVPDFLQEHLFDNILRQVIKLFVVLCTILIWLFG
jgi:protein phosphatase 1L